MKRGPRGRARSTTSPYGASRAFEPDGAANELVHERAAAALLRIGKRARIVTRPRHDILTPLGPLGKSHERCLAVGRCDRGAGDHNAGKGSIIEGEHAPL